MGWLAPSSSWTYAPKGLGVLGAQLEDVADLDALPQLEPTPAATHVPRRDGPQIGPLRHGIDVASISTPGEVPIVLIGPGVML
jgi:hypothetical protein